MKQIIEQRIAKLKEIAKRGINPYPHKYEVTHYSAEIKDKFDELSSSGELVSVAGRVMSKRTHGKASFAHIRDFKGDIQIYFKYDDLGKERYEFLEFVDIGDIIGVKGVVFKTRTGEITVRAQEYCLLTKSIRPLPEKWHGLRDRETRYRQRYVDLFVNLDVRQVFLKRTMIINSIRNFLNSRGFVEVETPVLQPIYGGASARPFTTHHNALDMDLYLRIADELYLKRLLVGGLDKVYEISKDFRNEGIDRTHSPEFTQLELYQAYADYLDMMEIFEEIVERVCLEVLGTRKITYGEQTVEVSRPWRRITVRDAVKEFAGIDIVDASDDELRRVCAKTEEKDWEGVPRGDLIDEILHHHVEPNLIESTILYDYPVEISPLAKRSRKDDRFAERFEPFMFGIELGNAFSELNDPIEQKQRFEEQRKQSVIEAEVDYDFLRALEYGMPPAGGLGVGIDRLVMVLTNSQSIRDVILFPQMRPEAEIEEELNGI